MADLTIGGPLDAATKERADGATVIGSADLTTHGVIVGMTGSGKTGLGVVLIEECLAAGIPTLLIDPKGDLTNLCLTFPALAPADFEPWVNESDVTKAGVTAAEYAGQQATTWREGLAGWGVDPERIDALRQAVEFCVYTPGSSAGRQLNLVGSLKAPKDGADPEDTADEIESYVTTLLGMMGIQADPLSSREHVLLSSLIANAWSEGRDLDLATLLAQVQQPPIRKLGVLELDQFYPAKDREAFAIRMNSLLASPGFATWLAGDPVDIESMLHTPDGRARCAIITTSHLSDEQRQSVTALVLAKFVTWTRRQSGSSELRALMYMDEVAGYLPPTANPPTKKPIMTLLKQARAFGVGVVLSTQNPVDVDYKALSNAGTWLIGRLQTERDKSRLMDGLKSAAGNVDLSALGDTISSLGKRQFVLKKAGSDTPSLTTTRWAMSYLRGPLMKGEISKLAEIGLVANEAACRTCACTCTCGARHRGTADGAGRRGSGGRSGDVCTRNARHRTTCGWRRRVTRLPRHRGRHPRVVPRPGRPVVATDRGRPAAKSTHCLVRGGTRCARILTGTFAALLVATAQAGTNVLVADDFNDNSIAGAMWTTSNPTGVASNGEINSPNGYIYSANRANILTAGSVSWYPASATFGGQHLAGTFYMAADSNRSQGDNVDIYTRSSNANNGGVAVATTYGISFSLGEGNHTASLNVSGYSDTWTQAPSAVGDMFLGASTN